MDIFKEKVCLITGAASGVGRGLSEALARHGARVVVTDIDGEGAGRVASGIGERAMARRLDVADAEAVEALVREVAASHGRLDYMFNNAGFAILGETLDSTVEQWRRLVDVNLMGVVYGSLAAYRVMAEQGHGHIVNTASLAGLIGSVSFSSYAMTKAGVVMLSKMLRYEGAGRGVRFTAVCPGFIKTGIYDNATYNRVDQRDAFAQIPFPLVELDTAIEKILRGVARNRELIVFPAYARILWWLTRFAPGLTSPLHRKTVRDLRKIRQS
ncbi:MAG TPA: SDR family NAD(P)-dependent oxidoreductase [Thermoanaerobaculia bacterium]|nr:SDR family NAD(P)-dependent oxidoreductase [Thermoanaerobaculia bacterium]